MKTMWWSYFIYFFFLLPLTSLLSKAFFRHSQAYVNPPINVITLYDKVRVKCVRVWCGGVVTAPPTRVWITRKWPSSYIPPRLCVDILSSSSSSSFPSSPLLPSSTLSYYVIHVFLPLILKGILPQSALRVNYWPNALWKIPVIIDSWSAKPEKKKSVSIEHIILPSSSL